MMAKNKKKAKASGKEHKSKVAQGLSDIVVMEAAHFGGFKEWETKKHFQCTSFTEGKSIGFVESNRVGYETLNKYTLSRTYPHGARIDSSNYHPQPHWNVGCQIVALNWQSSQTYELRLNKGRFVDNGNCGYVLKPAYLRDVDGAHPREKITLCVEVISAFCLPKPAQATKGEIVDPYVLMFVEGPELDGGNSVRTQTIDDNGFHPVWRGFGRNEATFTIPVWEMSTLVLQVWDTDVDADDFLAEIFVPLPLLKRGLRVFPLKDLVSHPLTGAVLICNISYV